MEQYINYVWTGLAALFILMKLAELYVRFTATKTDDRKLAENKFYQIVNGVYQFIRKEYLKGAIEPNDRLKKALDLLEADLIKAGVGKLTDELKDKAEVAIKGWHAEDKAMELTSKKSGADD